MASRSRRRVSVTDSDRLMCRTTGHAWDQVPADAPGKHGDPWWLRCMRCGTERHDECNWMTGELVHRAYVYDDTYRHAFDDSFDVTPSRQDFRRMLFAEHLSHVRRLRAVGGER